jgi:ligand-binding sensor domain-containing protein/serine phosphatase RsbU (regulator of sigma subunit)
MRILSSQKLYASVKLALILIFTSVSIIPVNSQTYYFDNYGVAEGLYQSKVYDILQDKEHYIWMGTLGGVSRFNGKEFTNYTSQNDLAQNGVKVLFKDSRGIIWLGHLGGGISRIIDKKPEVYLQSGAFIKNDITDISEDRLHRIWIATFGSGAYCIFNPEAKPKKIQYEQFKGNKLSDRIFSICLGKDSSLFLITDLGIRKYNYKSNSFEDFHPEGLTRYFSISCMMEDHDKNFWFGTYHGGLYKLDHKTNEFKIYDIRDGLASNWITTIKEDSQGNIWLGSWGFGITRIGFNGQIKIFNTGNGLQDDKIWCFFEDAEGNILIGTNEHGLSIYKGEQFITYNEKDGIGNPQIWAITQDKKDRYWFGTNGGITVFDPQQIKGKQFIYYNQDNKNISNQVRFLSKDKQNNIWIGSIDQGVMRFKLDQNRFIYESVINAYMGNSSQTTALTVDQSDNIWVGTIEYGLLRFNPDKQEITQIRQTEGLLSNEITALYADSKGVIWVGMKAKGINSIKDTSISSFPFGQGITPTCITEDKAGKIWIGTMGQGVLVLDKGKLNHTYTENDGLLANLINLLICGDDNSIFIGTNKGLNRLDTKENKIYSYTRKNGFTGIETKDNAVYKDASGNIWFGTINGVIRYNPALADTAHLEPLTHITRFRVNLKDTEIKQGLKLSYKKNGIIIDYHSICLSNPEAVRYQIMLEGADKEWQPPTEQTSVTYSALSPNKYVFKVKARNSNGIWNSKPVTFSFIIKPPFYKTWWFITLCIIIGAISIVTYISWHEKKLVEEKHILEDKVRERTIEVTQKNEELAMKNKDITDSIHYAKRIQLAILPPKIPYKDTFILFKPKDIVSGDFYWILQEKNYEFLAAVDCTGHGVPGAFMSIVGHIMLNKIVKEYKIYKPSEILNRLNQELTETLHTHGESFDVADGMDLSLVCYEPEKNRLQYAGAFNSLYLIRNGQPIEYPADRFSIGKNTGPDKKFANSEVDIEPGDMIFVSSDGYADQFGGADSKKFKRKALIELFVNITPKSADEQRNILDKSFEDWRRDIEQVDDVLVIGRKF